MRGFKIKMAVTWPQASGKESSCMVIQAGLRVEISYVSLSHNQHYRLVPSGSGGTFFYTTAIRVNICFAGRETAVGGISV